MNNWRQIHTCTSIKDEKKFLKEKNEKKKKKEVKRNEKEHGITVAFCLQIFFFVCVLPDTDPYWKKRRVAICDIYLLMGMN